MSEIERADHMVRLYGEVCTKTAAARILIAVIFALGCKIGMRGAGSYAERFVV